MIEILSPAGDYECLTAAVRAGADAVYLGMGNFNARRKAENFDDGIITDAVDYCHIRGVKVYLTLNTLVYEYELDDALNTAQQAITAGIDGIICTDLGLAAALKKCFPNVPLHASTQLTVHTKDALKILKELGFCRVVPSREMSTSELKELCLEAKRLQMETEVFVHGALCMCMSGQCLMSANLGGRSGNRGLCAGTCRLPFTAGGKNDHALSLKDMSLIKNIDDLIEIGVDSLKIEGRMKPPEYVAAATAACRQKIDNGTVDDNLWVLLEGVFSRNGFTDGYFTANTGTDMFGTRTEENAVLSREVQNKIHEYYRLERQSTPVDITFSCKKGENTVLTFCDGKHTVQTVGEVPQTAINREITAEYLETQLQKLGNTPYFAKSIKIDLENSLSLSASQINGMRRDAVEKLSAERARLTPPEINAFEKPEYTTSTKKPVLLAQFRDIKSIPQDLSGVFNIIIPAEQLSLYKGEMPVIADIPRGMSNTVLLDKCFENAKQRGATVMCGNLAAIKKAREMGVPFITSHSMNVLNAVAANVLEKLGAKAVVLSTEIKLNTAKEFLGGVPKMFMAYGKTPLMLARNCPIKASVGCENCHHKITDRKQINFPVYCRGGYAEILNSRPVWLADRMDEFQGFDAAILYFTDEPAEKCRKVIDAYLCSGTAEGEYTRGLYYKGVF